MRCKKSGLGGHGIFFLVAVYFGLFTLTGCEKPKPTVGDQVGDAIDDTIKATGQAAKSINKETVDLRDAVKQAVDDHLSTGNGN